jgi:hypothetical protein
VAGDLGTGSKGNLRVYKKTIQTLVHEDNIVLVGRTTVLLEEAYINLSKAAKRIALTINL